MNELDDRVNPANGRPWQRCQSAPPHPHHRGFFAKSHRSGTGSFFPRPSAAPPNRLNLSLNILPGKLCLSRSLRSLNRVRCHGGDCQIRPRCGCPRFLPALQYLRCHPVISIENPLPDPLIQIRILAIDRDGREPEVGIEVHQLPHCRNEIERLAP